jgi:drug/metabolite transporter (DMT)-like permease
MGEATGRHGWVHLILALVALSWGFNNIAMKIGLAHVTPGQFGGIRMLMAFPFMLYMAFGMRSRVPFSRRDALLIVIFGILGLGVFQTLYIVGVNETSTPLGGILMATMPVHVVLLALAFRLEKPEWRSITGVILALAGLVLLTLSAGQGEGNTETTLRGILFIVLAELGYGVNTTFLRPFMRKYPPMQVTGLAMAVSVLFYLVVYRKDMYLLDISVLPASVWVTTLYSGLVAFLIANTMWNIAVKHIGSTQVAVYGNLPPVIVMLFGALLFNEVLNGWQLIGSMIILAGVVLVQFRKTVPAIPSLPLVMPDEQR